MHKLILAALTALSFAATQAAAMDCEAQAVEKKLSGAAKTSFLKKCEAEARSGGAASVHRPGRQQEALRRGAQQFHQEMRGRPQSGGSAGPL